jgi:hypothetical protein
MKKLPLQTKFKLAPRNERENLLLKIFRISLMMKKIKSSKTKKISTLSLFPKVTQESAIQTVQLLSKARETIGFAKPSRKSGASSFRIQIKELC